MRAWCILAAVALARIAFGYQYQTIASLAPWLMPAYGLDYAALGTLIGLFVAPGVALALPLGLLGGRFGDRALVGGGLALMTVGPLICAAASAPLAIGAGRLLAGAGAVAVIVLQNKIISDWFAGRRFFLAISLSVAAYPVGVSAAQIVLPQLARPAAGFLSAAALAAGAMLLFLAGYRVAQHAPPPARRFTLPSRRECILVVIGGLMWTAYTGTYGGFVSYVPSLMAARGDPAWLAAAVMALATWGSVPPTLMGGALGARFGSVPVLVTGTLAATAGCALLALWGAPIASGLLFGVLGSVHPSVIMAAGTLSARPENRAVGMGLFYTTYYAGNAAAPAFCGWAADRAGGPWGAVLAAGFIGLAAIPLWSLHARLAARPARPV